VISKSTGLDFTCQVKNALFKEIDGFRLKTINLQRTVSEQY